jgi:hypothetical protein
VGLTWTDNHSNGQTRVEFRRWTADDSNAWQTFSTIARNTESVTVTGLLNGERYDFSVVATADVDSRDIVVDVASGTTETIASGDTLSVESPYTVAGTVDNRGTVDNEH